MDIKDESKRIFPLCQGCLSVDRKLKSITGQTKALFTKLREDVIQNENDATDLLLCWECIALLNKMKYFQARIKTAQYRLVQYLQTFYDDKTMDCLATGCYNNDKWCQRHPVFKIPMIDVCVKVCVRMATDQAIHFHYELISHCIGFPYNERDIPLTLSLLIKTKHKEYDYNYINEEDQKDLLFEQNNLIFEQKGLIFEQKSLIFEQKDLIFEQKEETDDERVLTDIKLESNEIIKEEYDNDNISLKSDTDYYEPEVKQETDEDFTLLNRNLKIGARKLKSRIKKYEELASVTKINGKFPKNISPYYDTVFVSSKEVEQNYREKNNRSDKNMPYKCKSCNIGYSVRLDYMRHKTISHNKLQFPTNCIACRREILSESHLEEHWKSYHNPMLRCTFCGELLRTMGELKKHLNRSHTKLFTCNSCSLEFRTLGEFSKHYILAHERVTCDYCNKNVCSKRKLEAHIKKKHLPGHCTICNKDYPTYYILEKHLKRVHPELVPHLTRNETSKEMRYCVECDKQYPTLSKYKRHLQQSVRHTPRKKVRIPCPACDKIFSRVSYKNNHYRLVHMKKSKHYCELCNKYFSNGYGVRKHIQHVHQKIPKPKDKICDLCGRGFSSNRILNNHRRTHTGERPFKCPYCPASFGQVTAMKTHQKTQHKNIITSG